MGFYIHSCVKMRYKAKFHPTYMLGSLQPNQSILRCADQQLDPESYDWNPLDEELLARLDTFKYVSLSKERHFVSNFESDEKIANGAFDPWSLYSSFF